MQATLQYIRKELQELYSPGEINEFIKLIFFSLREYSFTDLILKRDEKLTPAESERVCEIVTRIKTSEPIQYILGQSEFSGLLLKVNPAVLIPRPETEELVQWIISSQKTVPSRVLDIGTGSGCIALGLKKAFAGSSVSACDISEEALVVARENAFINQLDIKFFSADILNWENYSGWGETELIVSNPPYVTIRDKSCMKKNVTDFEPHQALFAPDNDPLKFYRQIARFSSKWLTENGVLYFEINEQYGHQVVEILYSAGFATVEIRKDMQGKERMIKGIRNRE